jgi:hypothetical protein
MMIAPVASYNEDSVINNTAVLLPPLSTGAPSDSSILPSVASGKPDHVPEVAFDAFDKQRAFTLSRIGTGFIHRLAGRHVTLNPPSLSLLNEPS